ncbi:rhomboid family intramembrane serine protease [Planctomycetota bacterium]
MMSTQCSGMRLTFAEPLNRTMIVLMLTLTGVFLLQALVPPFNRFAVAYLAMNTAAFLGKLYVWQAVTAIFLHGSVQHFVSNMIFLWFFGSALANAWSRRDFLTFFFVCGVAGSLCFYIVNVFRAGPEGITGLGASGAIFGLMIAYAMVFGERMILAFFLIPMKAKYFVGICVAIEILVLYTGAQDGISHITHLGGAVCGAAYLKIIWRRQSALAGATEAKAAPGSRIGGLEIMDDEE